MKSFIQKRPFLAFYLLAIAFPSALYAYLMSIEVASLARGEGSIIESFYQTQAQLRTQHPILTAHRDSVITFVMSYFAAPFAAPFLFFPFAPTVSALIITWLGWGGRGVAGLLGAYKPVRGGVGAQEAGRIYVALAALLLATTGLITAVVHFGGDDSMKRTLIEGFGLATWQTFAAALLTGFFLNQGGLLEELGWRGFAWPLLAKRFGAPLVAALVLGVFWALWHFPREVPGLLTGQTSLIDLAIGQGIFIIMCCAMSVVAVYFVNVTGGSVWPAIMVHGALNLFGGALTTVQEGTRSSFLSPSVFIWVAAALLLLLVAGPDLGWRRRQEIHGGDGSTDPANLWAAKSSR
jgi:membrane protease YdiL (CAAX protease family)